MQPPHLPVINRGPSLNRGSPFSSVPPQLLRHLSEHPATVPVWRRQRAALMREAASCSPSSAPAAPAGPCGGAAYAGPAGTLCLTGYVRSAGLSANQLLHIPGAGDFQIDFIEAAEEGDCERGAEGAAAVGRRRKSSAGGGTKAAAEGSEIVMAEAAGSVLARHDPEEREPLVRTNDGRGGDGGLEDEQTWPTEQVSLRICFGLEVLFPSALRQRSTKKAPLSLLICT